MDPPKPVTGSSAMAKWLNKLLNYAKSNELKSAPGYRKKPNPAYGYSLEIDKRSVPGTPRHPFQIYRSGDRIYIKEGLLPFKAGSSTGPIMDHNAYERPGGTDFDPINAPNSFFELDPAVSVWEIYLTVSIPIAEGWGADVPGFVAVPDSDYVNAVWINENTVFDWSIGVGRMFNYAIRLGHVDYDGTSYTVVNFDPLPPLHMVGEYRMYYAGTYDAAESYVAGAVVSWADSDFDYSFILDVAGVNLAYSPSEGPVIGVAPDPALSYPWKQLSKSPKTAALYRDGAYDAAKFYLNKA